MTHKLLSIFIALPLIACQPAADKADTGEAIAKDAGVGDGPTGRVGDPVSRQAENASIPANINEGVEPGASGNSVDPAVKPATIPAQFHGRWGLTANDCKDEYASAAKGLLTISGSRLSFYESRGTLGRVDSWTPANRFTANYAFQGEGQEWERTITFERTGNKLRRTEEGSEEGPVDLTYTACPVR